MKKVIIYGVKNLSLRREIENFLDDTYEIIGCSDGHYKEDFWNEYQFIPLEDLCSQDYDFILLCAGSSANREEMKRNLLAFGIPAEKILSPVMLLSGDEIKSNPDLIAEIDANYHGEKRLIFGLSYSNVGIDKERLKYPFYNCSARSLDLYYNFQQYNYMERRSFPLPINLQTVLWVFPYYYFDYDMSLSLTLYKIGAITPMWRLDDWHNYQCVPGASEYVENYRMFRRKVSQFYHAPKISPSSKSQRILGDPDGSLLIDGIWFSEHEKTVTENREIFVQFYRKITSAGCSPIIVIPPFYLDALNRISQKVFEKKRERFYRILRELEAEIGRVTVYDYANRFAGRRDFFRNWSHLNAAGAVEFTELINKELL